MRYGSSTYQVLERDRDEQQRFVYGSSTQQVLERDRDEQQRFVYGSSTQQVLEQDRDEQQRFVYGSSTQQVLEQDHDEQQRFVYGSSTGQVAPSRGGSARDVGSQTSVTASSYGRARTKGLFRDGKAVLVALLGSLVEDAASR